MRWGGNSLPASVSGHDMACPASDKAGGTLPLGIPTPRGLLESDHRDTRAGGAPSAPGHPREHRPGRGHPGWSWHRSPLGAPLKRAGPDDAAAAWPPMAAAGPGPRQLGLGVRPPRRSREHQPGRGPARRPPMPVWVPGLEAWRTIPGEPSRQPLSTSLSEDDRQRWLNRAGGRRASQFLPGNAQPEEEAPAAPYVIAPVRRDRCLIANECLLLLPNHSAPLVTALHQNPGPRPRTRSSICW